MGGEEMGGGGACTCVGVAMVVVVVEGGGLALFIAGVLSVEEEGEKTSLSTAALKRGMSEGSIKLIYALENLGSLVLFKCVYGRGEGVVSFRFRDWQVES